MRLTDHSEGHDEGMTPEEAANFYEPDEDAEALFAKYDAAPKGVRVEPLRLTSASQQQPSNYIAYHARVP